MASILRVNTLTDASSNNSTAMSTVFNGTVKVWVNFNGTGTVAIRDDFNVASITDRGTGTFTSNFTSNMANDDYSAMVGSGSTDATNRNSSVTGMTTSTLKVDTYNSSNTRTDHEFTFSNAHGDLA